MLTPPGISPGAGLCRQQPVGKRGDMAVVEHTSANNRLAWVERQFWIDQDVALAAAEGWLAELDLDEHGALHRRLEVQIASIMARRGGPQQGAASVQRILDWAQQHGDRTLQSRCHEVLGSIFELVGDRVL